MAEKLVKLRDLAQVGITKDQPAISQPPQTWTDGRNVRFEDNRVEKMKGHIQIFSDLEDTDAAAIKPTTMTYWRTPDAKYYLYGTNTDLYLKDKDDGVIHLNPDGTTFNDDGNWQQPTFFTGGYVVVVNNNEDVPHYADGTDSTIVLAPLPNWNYTTGIDITAKTIKGYKNVLVAGNITSENTTSAELDDIPANSTRYQPGTIRVSTQAPAGGVPQTWQPGATADTADEFELSATAGVQTMVELQGKLLIYTSDSIHAMTIGQTATLLNDICYGYGALSPNSVIEYEGKHFVVDSSDIYVWAGHPSNIQSVVDERIKDYFYNNLHSSFTDNVIVTRYKSQGEIWVSYPTRSSVNGYCDEAIIWNYHKNTWTIRDLFNASAVVEGGVVGGGIRTETFAWSGTAQLGATASVTVTKTDGSSISTAISIDGSSAANVADQFHSAVSDYEEFEVSYGTDTEDVIVKYLQYSDNFSTITVDFNAQGGDLALTRTITETLDEERPWPTDVINDSYRVIVFCDYENAKLYATDFGYQFDDTDYVSYVEKQFTDLDEVSDSSFIKGLMNLYPISHSAGNIKCSVAISNVPGETVTIASDDSLREEIFDSSEDYKIQVDTAGRYYHFRFEDDSATQSQLWSLSGYDIGIMTEGTES